MTATHPNAAAVRVAAVFASGIAINGLSDAMPLTAPLVVGLAVVALLLLLAAESSHTIRLPAALNPELAKFTLGSLLLGAFVGAIAVIPLGEARRLRLPQQYRNGDVAELYVHNYEVAAVVVLTGLAVVAASRRQSITRWLTYLAASLAGMTLSLTFFKGAENEALQTFLGWFAVSLIITLTLMLLPELGRLFGDFLWGRPPVQAPAGTAQEASTAAEPTEPGGAREAS